MLKKKKDFLIKNDQWARSIFYMLYLPWPDQKVIKDRKKPNWNYWENARVKCNKRVIINISEIRIYLWSCWTKRLPGLWAGTGSWLWAR
jgi:hypothetical protein